MPRRSTAIEAPRPGNSHRRALFVAIGLVAWMLLIGGADWFNCKSASTMTSPPAPETNN